MIQKLFFAGSGGQGVILMGQMTAYAAMYENKEVTFLPSYGPEMRGGTANCSVIISEHPIASPLCNTPDVLIAMNSPSFHKFAPRVRSGGIIIVNGSVSDCYAGRDDVRICDVAAGDIALEAGDVRSANMVMLGAFIALTGAVKERSIFNCLNEKFVGKPHVLDCNRAAFEAGVAAVKSKLSL